MLYIIAVPMNHSGEPLRRIIRLVVTVFLLLAVPGVVVAQAERTLTGEFVWSQRGKSGELRVLFKSTGESRWDVAFHFNFRERSYVYRGRAEGTLGSGNLQGEVLNDDLSRTFTFEGTFEQGTFKGTHAEVKKRGPQSTGTLTLRE